MRIFPGFPGTIYFLSEGPTEDTTWHVVILPARSLLHSCSEFSWPWWLDKGFSGYPSVWVCLILFWWLSWNYEFGAQSPQRRGAQLFISGVVSGVPNLPRTHYCDILFVTWQKQCLLSFSTVNHSLFRVTWDFKKMYAFSKYLKLYLFLIFAGFLFSGSNLLQIQLHLCCFLPGKTRRSYYVRILPFFVEFSCFKPGGYSWLEEKETHIWSISKSRRNVISILYAFPTYISQEPSKLNINKLCFVFFKWINQFPKAIVKRQWVTKQVG